MRSRSVVSWRRSARISEWESGYLYEFAVTHKLSLCLLDQATVTPGHVRSASIGPENLDRVVKRLQVLKTAASPRSVNHSKVLARRRIQCLDSRHSLTLEARGLTIIGLFCGVWGAGARSDRRRTDSGLVLASLPLAYCD